MSDAISRKMAIEALGEEPEIWNDTEEEWAYRNAWVEHISAIKSLPSADRPTGEWVVVSDGYGNGVATANICECSVCGDTVWVYKDGKRRWNYCPNCGARMYKGGEDE